jgi:membrane-associated phospholipid phosphatase
MIITLSCMLWGALSDARGGSRERAQRWTQLGWRLATFWVIGVLINQCLKYGIRAPRPWWVDPHVLPLHPNPARGFGMPSGHTQSAVGLWIALWVASDLWTSSLRVKDAPALGRRLLILSRSLKFAGAMWVGLIAYSRVALHEHSLAQVYAGASVGVVWCLSLIYLERARWGALMMLSVCLGLSALSISLSDVPLELPDTWVEEITRAGVVPPTAPSLLKTLGLCCAALVCIWRSSHHQRWRDRADSA